VLGREFSRAGVLALSPGEQALPQPAALMSLAAKRLVVLGDADEHRFHHALVRDVAYRGISKSVRALLHERAADWLDAARQAPDEVIGSHLEQAYRYRVELGPPDGHARRLADDAGRRLGAAGVRAWKRADSATTLNLLGLATSLLAPDDVLRLELLCELGLAAWAAGEPERPHAVLREVAETAMRAGERRLELRALIDSAHVALFRDPEGRSDELLTLAAKAIPIFEALGDDRSLGRTWLGLAFVQGLSTAATPSGRMPPSGRSSTTHAPAGRRPPACAASAVRSSTDRRRLRERSSAATRCWMEQI